MKLKVEAQVGDARVRAAETPGNRPGFSIDDLPPLRRQLLLSCIAFDTFVVLWLAVWNATLTQSGWDLIGIGLLFGIGIVCALALAAVLRRSSSAVMTVIVSQIFVVCLAAYIWLVDQRSPVSQLLGVTGVALLAGGIALLWACHLGRYARSEVTRAAAVIAALFPLMGLMQFWMQTDYLPRSSLPAVDVTTELEAVGSSGPIVHLLAKVTLHNRGAVQADVSAAVVRVTAYPIAEPTNEATIAAVADGINPLRGQSGGGFRVTPTFPVEAKLLYADNISSLGSFLSPGGTEFYQAIVDIDSRTDRLARLSVDAVFVTQRMVRETTTCDGSKLHWSKDPTAFYLAASQPHSGHYGGQVLCTQTQFAPSSSIQDLVSDHPVLRVEMLVESLGVEVPALVPFFGTPTAIDDPDRHVASMQKAERANPSSLVWTSAEYAVSDADLRGRPG